jgi:Ca2+-binding RTX toxin-like protein
MARSRLAATLVGVAIIFNGWAVPARAAVMCFGEEATILGTGGNDSLRGTLGADVIIARGGDDITRGRDGNDRICGGPGDDIMQRSARQRPYLRLPGAR